MSMHTVPNALPETPTAVLRIETEEVWQRLVTEWLPLWLQVESVPRVVGAPLRGLDGSRRGRVLGCHVGHRVHLEWVPTGADDSAAPHADDAPVSSDTDGEGTQQPGTVMLEMALSSVPGATVLTVRSSDAGSADVWRARLADLEAVMARTTGPIPVLRDVLTTA